MFVWGKFTRQLTPKFTRPEILLCPNVPKPLHGLNPRSILGKKWWDQERERAYETNNYCCFACGINKLNASIHKWLEAHEMYKYDYENGTATLTEIVALCPNCHNYIHSGRLASLLSQGEITSEIFISIINHGNTVLSKAKLPINAYAATQMLWFIEEGHTLSIINTIKNPSWINIRKRIIRLNNQFPVKMAPWQSWRLILNGKEYYTKFTNIDEWTSHYNDLEES